MKKDYWAYLGVVIGCCLFLATCDGCEGEGDETYEESSGYYEQPQSSEYEMGFSNEQSVRNYLCNHRFSSSDGTRLSFSDNANAVYVNGTQLTSTTDVSLVNEGRALIRTHGPYGNTTFILTISSSGDGLIQDRNDGETYFAN